MDFSTPASNLDDISTERRSSSIAGGLPNTTKSGEVTPSIESPLYNNIIIPESTLDLFFQHFNSLQKQLEEINAHMSRNSVITVDSLSPAPASQEVNKELVTRISALQELVMNQTSQLEELRVDRQLLLEENKLMKEQINSLSVNLSALRDSANIVNDFTSCATAGDEIWGINAAECRDEGSEMVISCGADCGKIKMPPEDFSFAVLHTVLPSLSKSDIKAVKILSPNSSALGSVTLENQSPETSENAQKSEIIDGPRSAFSLLVRLSSGELLKQIFKEKRNLTSFSLMDINPSLLGETSTSKLTQTNIFINYYLQKEKYNEFRKLRTYAKTIGLKYVWHRGGKFFTKKGDGERAYVFSTKEDLDRILLQPQKINKITINTNVNSESGLQNDNNHNNNNNNNNMNKITIISQKVNSRKTNKVRGGKNQNENKIENNTKAKNKKTKNQKVTNTPIISTQNISSPA